MKKMTFLFLLGILSNSILAATEIEKLSSCLKASAWGIGTSRVSFEPEALDSLDDNFWSHGILGQAYLLKPNGDTLSCKLVKNNFYYDASEEAKCKNNSINSITVKKFVTDVPDPMTNTSDNGFINDLTDCNKLKGKPIPGTTCTSLYDENFKASFFKKIKSDMDRQFSFLEDRIKKPGYGNNLGYSVDQMFADADLLISKCSNIDGLDLSVQKQKISNLKAKQNPKSKVPEPSATATQQ